MNNHLDRIHHFTGTPYDIGFSVGQTLGGKLEKTFSHYIANMSDSSDMEKLHTGALPWLRNLPKRFQGEFEGMAAGANIPLQNLDVFTPTGINKEKLWLHDNFLPVWDQPRTGKPHIPCYVFLTEALELGRSISDVEALLNETDRDGGMLLFAVDGKTNEFALFDCMCSKHFRRNPSDGWIVGTNHYCACEDLTLGDDEASIRTLNRFSRAESLVRDLCASPTCPSLPADLIRILADDRIERRVSKLVTAYSNVACPNTGEVWYTFGGYSSASKGDWQQLEWPWKE